MGQTFSQAPQPMHSDGSTCGRCTLTVSIASASPLALYLLARFGTSTSSAQIALGEVGQNSSQTMHGVAIAHGKQRPWSYMAVPIAIGFCSLPVFSSLPVFCSSVIF